MWECWPIFSADTPAESESHHHPAGVCSFLPSPGKAQQPHKQCYPFLSVCVAFLCSQTMVWLLVFGIFNPHTDVKACNCTRRLYRHCMRVCTGSWLREKNLLWQRLCECGSGQSIVELVWHVCVLLRSRNDLYFAVFVWWVCLCVNMAVCVSVCGCGSGQSLVYLVWHVCHYVLCFTQGMMFTLQSLCEPVSDMHVLCFTQGMMFSLQSVCECGSDICMCCASLREWCLLCSHCVNLSLTCMCCASLKEWCLLCSLYVNVALTYVCVVLHSGNDVYSAVTVWTCLWHVCVLQSVCEHGSDICMCCASLKEWCFLCSLCVWMLLWPVPCWVDLTWCWCCWTPRMRTGTRWCPPSSWRTKIPWVMPKTLQTMLAGSFFRPAKMIDNKLLRLVQPPIYSLLTTAGTWLRPHTVFRKKRLHTVFRKKT